MKDIYKKLGILAAILIYDLITFLSNLDDPFNDFPLYLESGSTLLNGINPYTARIEESNYPPGQFFLYAFIITVFGANELGFKIAILVAHYINCYLLFILSKIVLQKYIDFKKKHPNINRESASYRSEKNEIKIPILIKLEDTKYKNFPWYAVYAFMIFPPERMRVFDGENDSYPIMFLILFLIFFLKERYAIAGFFCAISMLIKLTTFLIIPYILYFFIINKEWKKMWGYLGVLVITVLAAFLPFLIDDFYSTITGINSLAHEPTTIANHFKLWENYTILHEGIIHIWVLQFSVWFLIENAIYWALFFYLIGKIKPNNQDLLFITMILVYFTIPILTHSFGIRYYAWAGPLVAIYVVANKDYKLFAIFFLFYPFVYNYYASKNYIAALIIGVPLNIYLFIYILKRIREYSGEINSVIEKKR